MPQPTPTPRPLDFMSARTGLLADVQQKVRRAGVRVLLPGIALVYLATAVSHPCWQTFALLVGVVALGAAWVYSFRVADRGNPEGSALVVAGGTLAFSTLEALVRQGALMSEVVAIFALSTYVALFSQRYLVLSILGSGGLLVVLLLVGWAGWIPQLVLSPEEALANDIAFVMLIFPAAAYFLRRSQTVSQSLFEQMERSGARQEALLGTVQRIQPTVTRSVQSIQGVASGFSASATQQAASSAEITRVTADLARVVAEGATAVEEARAIGEQTRADASTSRAKLGGLEQVFETVLRHIEGAHAEMDALAADIARTEEINSAISELVERLKVLGINASLEAARSGEAGRGFGVVANELQRMMQLTASDLQNSSVLLERIRQHAALTAERAAQSTEELRRSVGDLRTTAGLVEGIVGGFGRTFEQVDAIAQGANRQRAQLEAIAEAMRAMEQSADQLRSDAQTLVEGVGRIDAAQQELQATLGPGGGG